MQTPGEQLRLMYYVANACSNRNLCNWRVDKLETFYATQHVRVLPGQGGPASRNRVLRDPGVTPAAKRTHGMCRARDGASKQPHCGADAVMCAEGTTADSEESWAGSPPGSESEACTQGSSRNLGDLVFSTEIRRRGRRDRKGPGPRGVVRLRGSEGGQSGGSAERRRRSEARREARSRSRRIVCAGQRPDRVGSSPTDARVRGVISKGGGNASLAGAC